MFFFKALFIMVIGSILWGASFVPTPLIKGAETTVVNGAKATTNAIYQNFLESDQ